MQLIVAYWVLSDVFSVLCVSLVNGSVLKSVALQFIACFVFVFQEAQTSHVYWVSLLCPEHCMPVPLHSVDHK